MRDSAPYDIPVYLVNNLRKFVRDEIESSGLRFFLFDLYKYNRVLTPLGLEIHIPSKNLEYCLNTCDFKYEDLGLIVHFKRG